jgi:hypothetical protein
MHYRAPFEFRVPDYSRSMFPANAWNAWLVFMLITALTSGVVILTTAAEWELVLLGAIACVIAISGWTAWRMRQRRVR